MLCEWPLYILIPKAMLSVCGWLYFILWTIRRFGNDWITEPLPH